MTLTAPRTVELIDVGQGDCSLVVDRESESGLLIDCTAGAVRNVLKRIRSAGVSVLDVLITHWDADHYAGAARIALSFPARKVYFNIDAATSNDPSEADRRRLALESIVELDSRGAVLQRAQDDVSGSIGSVNWALLAPQYNELVQAIMANDRNHASAVVHVEGAKGSALIGGDADGSILARIMRDGRLPRATVLRCGHHGGSLGGSPDAINESQLYRAVRPEAVVISAGTKNRYGHPDPKWIVEAAAENVRVMCTEATPRCAASGTDDRPCAGDVELSLDTGEIRPDRATHEQAMIGLMPLCRPTLGSAMGF